MAESPTITLVIPTISRPTLARTLASVRRQDWIAGDEILLVGDGPQPIARALWEQYRLPGRYLEVPGPSRDWGHTPRNLVMPQAKGRYLVALDDDDQFTDKAVRLIRQALAENPDRPHLFRGDFSGVGLGTVWKDREVKEGNVSTVLFVVPTAGQRWARYTPRYGGDYDFCRDTLALWPAGALVWREEVICRVRPRCANPETPQVTAASDS